MFIENLKLNIIQSFVSLPLILIGWCFFMGITQANIGYLVLSMGQITAVPILTYLLNLISEFLFSTTSLASFFTVATGPLTTLIPYADAVSSGSTTWVGPSYWMAQTTFFFSFLITNAISLLRMKAVKRAPSDKVENRKSQATLSLMISLAVFIAIIVLRLVLTDSETIASVALSLAGFIPLGVMWFNLAKSCSARDTDIFGIVQGILPASATESPPMTCVYTK